MINELFNLSAALDGVQTRIQSWHREYGPIPNIRANAPCIRITVLDGKIVCVSLIDANLGRVLRKYGSKQGSYPCMNLAPLYRVTDKSVKDELKDLGKHPEKVDAAYICRIKMWCMKNNWEGSFRAKYKICMENKPAELSTVAAQYPPLKTLTEETNLFVSASALHTELERVAFEMLERREQISLALTVLFHQGNANKSQKDDHGALSVAFDSAKLIDEGVPAVSERFVHELNEHLLKRDDDKLADCDMDLIDAFGVPFRAIEEPMPTVKLAGGFDAALRTMFREQKCQTRYGRIENASYPISPQMRIRLKAALEWIGGRTEQKNVTWINTDKNEILFAYPLTMSEAPISYTTIFKKEVAMIQHFLHRRKSLFKTFKRQRSLEQILMQNKSRCLFCEK